MKKVLLITALVISMSFNVFAQRSDGFFSGYDNDPYNRIDNPIDIGLHMPSGTLGATNSEPAPIGNGLLILAAFGAGYAMKKQKQ